MKELDVYKRHNREIAKRHIDYKRTFESDHGERVLFDLMNHHNFMSIIDTNDPIELARAEGARAVVVRILSYMKLDAGQIRQRVREADKYVTQKISGESII